MTNMWKKVVAWLLVIAMLTGYGNTAYAAELVQEEAEQAVSENIDNETEVEESVEAEQEPAASDAEEPISSESKEEPDEEELIIEEVYETVEINNPFQERVENETGSGSSGISAFRFGQFEKTYGDQLTDPLTQEIYQLMVDTFVEEKAESASNVSLTNRVVYNAELSGGSIVKNDA